MTVAAPTAAVELNVDLLAQGVALCRRLSRADFGGEGNGPGAAVGPHVRHCIELVAAFLAGLDGGRVDYDARARDLRLEVDPAAAADALEAVASRLAELPPEVGERFLLVRLDVAPGEAPEAAWAPSSGARELRALVSHTVHHYALIALLLRARGIEPGADFGVAPATLAHRRRLARR